MTIDEARAEFLRQKAAGLDPLILGPDDCLAVVHRPDYIRKPKFTRIRHVSPYPPEKDHA